MRTPMPRIKLTEDEKELCMFMADEAHMDWFEIAGWWTVDGKVQHPSRGGMAYDEVWSSDSGKGHYVSVQFGVRVLMEGFDTLYNMNRLSTKQMTVFKELAKKVGYPIDNPQ